MTPFPRGRFTVIYADPAWKYNNVRTGGSLKSGASQKYSTMDLDEIKELPLREHTADDAVLFLWTTNPFLPDAFDVMRAWGFEYKTTITWLKTRLGIGFWLRGQTEHLLFGIKGDVKPFRSSVRNFIQVPTLQHSEKPRRVQATD